MERDPEASADGVASTLTFLFTDIEGSTRLIQQLGASFEDVLRRHHAILDRAVRTNGGTVERTEGDAFFATFPTVGGALDAAIGGQRALADQAWPMPEPLRVRMGMHTGEASRVSGELVGIDIHRAARIAAAGWGEQVLVSQASQQLLSGERPGVSFRDLGPHDLRDLPAPERIYQVVCAGLREQFPALRGRGSVSHNLPPQLTGLVGRDDEAEEVAGLLRDARLVTLTGPGGTGKTRLSLRVAADVLGEFPDGVTFVALAPISEPDLVLPTIARTLGLAETPGRDALEILTDHLADRTTLLVLDNLEQVVAAGPDIAKLLAAAAGLRVLASSRAPLRVYGEREYPVPPLDLPPPGADLDVISANPAAQLFLDRATAVRPDLVLNAETAPAVAAITRRLDGLPLAIELAAARTRLLSVQAIAERLGRSLDELSGGARDLPDRQRTLRGAIAWSWDLLDEPARTLFARLSVFSGGGSIEAIDEVCAPGLGVDLLDALADLVDQSLVRRGADDRFSMLETIREFADEQLAQRDECDETRERHGAVFLSLLERQAPRLTGEDGREVLRDLEAEHDNLRVALVRAVERGDTRTALRFLAGSFRLWQMRGHLNEASMLASRVLAMPGTDAFPREHGEALEAAGGVAYWRGETDDTRRFYEGSLERYREVGDANAIARGLYNLGFGYWDDPERGRDVFEEAVAAFEAIGDELGVARSHWALAVAYFWLKDFVAIERHIDRCLPVFVAAGESFDVAWSLHMRGFASYGQERFDEAAEFYKRALEMFVEVDDLSGIYLTLADFAILAEAEFDDERSLRIWGAVDRLSEETGTGLADRQLEVFPRKRDARAALPEDLTTALLAEGRQMSREEAVAYAFERVV